MFILTKKYTIDGEIRAFTTFEAERIEDMKNRIRTYEEVIEKVATTNIIAGDVKGPSVKSVKRDGRKYLRSSKDKTESNNLSEIEEELDPKKRREIQDYLDVREIRKSN